MSNTAERWWVRFAARWLARIDGVKAHIQVASLGVTAFSTFSLVLQNSGHGNMVVPLGVLGLVLTPIYTYLYSEGGVWNQVARDRVDLSTNFVGPTIRIDDELTARAIGAMLKGRELNTEERKAIKQEMDAGFTEYRDGYDIEKNDTQH